jgi:hypothetical protein
MKESARFSPRTSSPRGQGALRVLQTALVAALAIALLTSLFLGLTLSSSTAILDPRLVGPPSSGAAARLLRVLPTVVRGGESEEEGEHTPAAVALLYEEDTFDPIRADIRQWMGSQHECLRSLSRPLAEDSPVPGGGGPFPPSRAGPLSLVAPPRGRGRSLRDNSPNNGALVQPLLRGAGPRVPNIVHFVFDNEQEEDDEGGRMSPPPFTFAHYATVASALKLLRPDRAILSYTRSEPDGLFWDMARPFLEVRRVAAPGAPRASPTTTSASTTTTTTTITRGARSEALKIAALLEFGGIALDLGIVTLRPFLRDRLLAAAVLSPSSSSSSSSTPADIVALVEDDAVPLVSFSDAPVLLAVKGAGALRHRYLALRAGSPETPPGSDPTVAVLPLADFTAPLVCSRPGPEGAATATTAARADQSTDKTALLDLRDTAAAQPGCASSAAALLRAANFSLATLLECDDAAPAPLSVSALLAPYVPTPLVSVVVPCSGGGGDVSAVLETVKSVVAQRFRSWELLLAVGSCGAGGAAPAGVHPPAHASSSGVPPHADGAHGDCVRLVQAWVDANYPASEPGGPPPPPIVVIRAPEATEGEEGILSASGSTAALLNLALSRARGHLVTVLRSGDKISPDYFYEAQAALSADPNLGLIYSDQQFFGQSSWYWDVPEWDPVAPLARGPLPVMTVYRRSLWEAVGGYSSSLPRGNEDYDFWLKLVEVGVRGKKISPGKALVFAHVPAAAAEEEEEVAEVAAASSAAPPTSTLPPPPLRLSPTDTALLRMRHPTLFHPAALLPEHDIAATISEATLEMFVARHAATAAATTAATPPTPLLEDRFSLLLWLATSLLHRGAADEADAMLAELASLPAVEALPIYSRRVGYQASLLSLRVACARGDKGAAATRAQALAAAYPALQGVSHFEFLLKQCAGGIEVRPAAPAAAAAGGWAWGWGW